MRRDSLALQKLSEEFKYISHIGTMLEAGRGCCHVVTLTGSEVIHSLKNSNGEPGPTLVPGYCKNVGCPPGALSLGVET